MSNHKVIWGSINIDFTEQWYQPCLSYMSWCSQFPDIAVVLEATPISSAIKVELLKYPIQWYFITHGAPRIDNINNDNARNLRFLIPHMISIANKNDLLLLVEQDVLMCKQNWLDSCHELLENYKLISAAGSYVNPTDNTTRRGKPKPYFSIFKGRDGDEILHGVRTNRGSFVTINIDDKSIFRLDKHQTLHRKAHAFGTKKELWAVHTRGGSNHNGLAQQSIDYFSTRRRKRALGRLVNEWPSTISKDITKPE